MLDMDASKMPTIKDTDFTDENQYYLMTKPMELDVDMAQTEDFWNRGLTGGESGQKMREAKQNIVDTIRRYSGEELRTSDIEWDKDNNEFVAYHRPSRPGDVGKSFWKVSGMTQTIRFRKEKRTGYITAADGRGEDIGSHYAWHNYTIRVRNTGTKEY